MSDQHIDRRKALKLAGASAIAGTLAGCGPKQDQLPGGQALKEPSSAEDKQSELLHKLIDAGVEVKNVHGAEPESLEDLKTRSSLSRDELERLASDPKAAADFTAWGAWKLRF